MRKRSSLWETSTVLILGISIGIGFGVGVGILISERIDTSNTPATCPLIEESDTTRTAHV